MSLLYNQSIEDDTYCRISALIALERLASDLSNVVQASLISCYAKFVMSEYEEQIRHEQTGSRRMEVRILVTHTSVISSVYFRTKSQRLAVQRPILVLLFVCKSEMPPNTIERRRKCRRSGPRSIQIACLRGPQEAAKKAFINICVWKI